MSNKNQLNSHTGTSVQAGDTLLTTREFEARYKISRPTQCRHRKNGDGPPFVNYRGKVLYPEKNVIAWLNSHLVISSAGISSDARGARYLHLPAAREKAKEKQLAKKLAESESIVTT